MNTDPDIELSGPSDCFNPEPNIELSEGTTVGEPTTDISETPSVGNPNIFVGRTGAAVGAYPVELRVVMFPRMLDDHFIAPVYRFCDGSVVECAMYHSTLSGLPYQLSGYADACKNRNFSEYVGELSGGILFIARTKDPFMGILMGYVDCLSSRGTVVGSTAAPSWVYNAAFRGKVPTLQEVFRVRR